MKILILLILSTTTFANITCEKLQVSQSGKEPFEKELCFNDRFDTIYSPDCKESSCEAYETLYNKKKDLKDIHFDSQFGNPTIFTCTRLGNIAENVTIKTKKKSYSITWCRKNNSVVDTGLFFMKFMELRK
jgi:hypothetical protein